MPLPKRFSALALLLFATGVSAQPPRKGDVWEADTFEEQAIHQAAGRFQNHQDWEGKRWERELARAFPLTHKAGRTEADVEKWFDLLAGEGREWRRDAAPTKVIAELFDHVAQHSHLGPVPTIRREEFLNFAKGRLSSKPQRAPDPKEKLSEAEKAFRVLDRDGSGSLEATEWTERIRSDIKNADADGNRRISPEEYREHFARKTAEMVETWAATAAKMEAASNVGRDGGGGKWPDWLKKLDTDGDGQVGLYEWRASGRSVEEFLAMDLDGDGLLPPAEYSRYAAMKPDANPMTAVRKTEPMPPEQRVGMPRK